MERLSVEVSYFRNRWNKSPEVVTLDSFVADMRGPRWQVATEAYRRWKSQGMEAEAERQKSNMPGITVAGVFRGGHAAHQLKTFSGLAMFDLDHTDERTAELRSIVDALPWTVLAFTSISGQGIKVLVRVNACTAAQYATAYALVAAEISRLTGFPCDMACRDLGRICSAVYDAGLHYRPDAEEFAWRTLSDASTEDASGTDAQAEAAMPAGEGTGFTETFLDDFDRRNPFMKGTRHDTLLKLGRTARYKGFSMSEFQKFVEKTIARYASADFTESEISKTLHSGYQFVSSKSASTCTPFQGPKGPGSTLAPSGPCERGGDEDDLSELSNELRASMPYFPDSVYEHLPELLAKGSAMARAPRERDMLLMGMMANLSLCLPSIRFVYDRMEYSPHLYFAGVSPAGTGKGVVALAAHLTQPLHEYYAKLSAEARVVHEEQKRRWEMELQCALREKRAADVSLTPGELKQVYLMIPANSSKSRVYGHLRDNGDLGGIINTTEINTLSSAIGQDYGKQDDLLCAAAHHERIASSFKVDGEPICVETPRLGMSVTGTPEQFVSLVKSQENGLYSRFALLTAEPQWQWRSAAPSEDSVEYRAFFLSLGRQVAGMHRQLLESPTQVSFTPSQWEEHTACFSKWLGQVVMEGEDSPGAIVLRHGLLAMRLASVFTALRKCESGWWAKEYVCTDDDFHAAMQMVRVLIEHSLLVSSSLPEASVKSLPLHSFRRALPLFNKMLKSFTYSDFLDEALKMGISRSTAKRILKRAEKLKFVEYQVNKYVKKKKFTE